MTSLHDAHSELQERMAKTEAYCKASRALTEQLERVREDERTALVRELHDASGQALSASTAHRLLHRHSI